VEVVILVAEGITPVALMAAAANLFAPLPAAKLFVQFTMSVKFSVLVLLHVHQWSRGAS